MQYKSLEKLYYQEPQKWESIYRDRFSSEHTEHFDFYVRQLGYPSLHQCFYCPTNEISLLLNEILSSSIQLLNIINSIPGVGIAQFLHSLMVEEIKANNDIEGVHSTRREITFAMAQTNPPRYVRLWGIVNKYNKIISADDISINTCEDIRNLYNDFLLKEVERADPRNVPDGLLFRQESVDILSETGKSLHRGVLPEEKIISMLSYALSVLHSDKFPKLVGLAIFHCMFAYIHPFYDGNGRTIRFITSYYLARLIHPTVALRLSYLIKQHKNTYYKSFNTMENDRNRGDLTPFITYSLLLIKDAVISTHDILSQKLDEFRSYASVLKKLCPDDDSTSFRVNHILLQASIYSDLGATIEEIQNALGIKSRKTIQTRINATDKKFIVIDDSVKPYRYKLNLIALKELL